MNKGLPIAIVVLVVVIAIAVIFLYHPSVISKITSTTSTAAVPIALTDPAEVPANTTSLIISYSSFRILYFNSTGAAGVENVNASGSVNILLLVNSSKILAKASLPLNSFIKSIQFNVTNASATINGTVYSIKVSSPVVTATVPANYNRINSSSDLILDFTPALVSVYTANSTEYILLPSMVAVSSTGLFNSAVGAVNHIPANINRSLFSGRANITITSASLQQIGNDTLIKVTVKDNSNSSVLLQHLRLKLNNGFRLSSYNISGNVFNDTKAGFSGSISKISRGLVNEKAHLPSFISNLNGSLYSDLNSVAGKMGLNVSLGNFSSIIGIRSPNIKQRILLNVSNKALSQFNITRRQINQTLAANEQRVNIMRRIIAGMSINFFISANGTMFLPFSGNKLFNLPLNFTNARLNLTNGTNVSISYPNSGLSNTIANNSSFSVPFNFGYSLAANSSVTLTFNGTMNIGEGLVSLQLLSGMQYSLYLQGTDGAYAGYTVNATS